MPPKIKINRDMIVSAALDHVVEGGYGSLNARSLAARLQCSTQPVYSVFENMDDVKSAVFEKAFGIAEKEITGDIDNGDFLNSFALSYVRFATENPSLFHLVFVSPFKRDKSIMDIVLKMCPAKDILGELGRRYNIGDSEALGIFSKAWYFVHGVACFANDRRMFGFGDDGGNLDAVVENTVRDIVRGEILRYGF